jgi:mono/diheme cytochrome c family protein
MSPIKRVFQQPIRGNNKEKPMRIDRKSKIHWFFSPVLFVLLLGQPSFSLAQEEQPPLSWGKDLFMTHCSACHGEGAKGDGPVGVALKTSPADLTQISKKNGGTFPRPMVMEFIDGERPIPAHGPRRMPIWGKIFRAQRTDTEARMRIFALTVFLESIQER